MPNWRDKNTYDNELPSREDLYSDLDDGKNSKNGHYNLKIIVICILLSINIVITIFIAYKIYFASNQNRNTISSDTVKRKTLDDVVERIDKLESLKLSDRIKRLEESILGSETAVPIDRVEQKTVDNLNDIQNNNNN